MINENLIQEIVKRVKAHLDQRDDIPVGISSRHVHLSQNDLNALFGDGYELQILRPLSQPNQFAAKETVDLLTEKGVIENVRILGPVRKNTQVELAKTDAVKLGIDPPVRNSGNIENSVGVKIRKNDKIISIKNGVIIAQRHIHMNIEDGIKFGVVDGQLVTIGIKNDRGGSLKNVVVRIHSDYKLDCHLDTDEGNAFGLKTGDNIVVVRG